MLDARNGLAGQRADSLGVMFVMRTAVILLAAWVSGCSASRPAPVSDPVELRPAGVDLTGAWATGSANEPEAREVVLRPACNIGPAIWLLEQQGDTLRLREIPASFAQGVPSPSRPIAAAIEGRVSGLDVTLGASGARYVLRYDSTSGHLRGTFNGAPFWAARQVVIRPPGCIPPP